MTARAIGHGPWERQENTLPLMAPAGRGAVDLSASRSLTRHIRSAHEIPSTSAAVSPALAWVYVAPTCMRCRRRTAAGHAFPGRCGAMRGACRRVNATGSVLAEGLALPTAGYIKLPQTCCIHICMFEVNRFCSCSSSSSVAGGGVWVLSKEGALTGTCQNRARASVSGTAPAISAPIEPIC